LRPPSGGDDTGGREGLFFSAKQRLFRTGLRRELYLRHISAGLQPELVSTLISACPCRGDADRDGDTDFDDFMTLVMSFGQPVPPGTLGDLDADGAVTVYDFAILTSVFGCGR
jgi:hypothetical protein